GSSGTARPSTSYGGGRVPPPRARRSTGGGRRRRSSAPPASSSARELPIAVPLETEPLPRPRAGGAETPHVAGLGDPLGRLPHRVAAAARGAVGVDRDAEDRVAGHLAPLTRERDDAAALRPREVQLVLGALERVAVAAELVAAREAVR